MGTDREQDKFLWLQFVRLQSVGQQGLPVVDLELMNENAVQVAPFFFPNGVVIRNGLYRRIQDRFVFGVQLFGGTRKGWRDQNGQGHAASRKNKALAAPPWPLRATA